MQRNLLSINSLDEKTILAIFKHVDKIHSQKLIKPITNSKVGGLLFFEASTRTRIGFEVAAWKLGIKAIVMQETKNTESMSKAESIQDTIRTLNPYVDFYCIRHPDESIFKQVTPFTTHPIINCGNGYKEHPTQALIDGYTIWNKFGQLNGLNITIIGALEYSRAVHSLLILLSNFSNNTVNLISPSELRIQGEYKQLLKENGNSVVESTNHEWGSEDVVYVAGFAPINPSGKFSQATRDKYKITTSIVKKLGPKSIILNPLPRIDEIDGNVDGLPNAYYFKQNELGLSLRMAVLDLYCL